MAIELCPENSNISPRLSFSHDLRQSDIIPIEQRPFRPSSSGSNSITDFDFCNFQTFDQESWTGADEFFSDGKILPTEIKKKPEKQLTGIEPEPEPEPEAEPEPQFQPKFSKQSSKAETKGTTKQSKVLMRDETGDGDNVIEEKQSSTKSSFWGFKRSSSLNCGSGSGRNFCPLPLLSRSNSTGTNNNVKQTPLLKEIHGNNQKQSSLGKNCGNYQKPPLKKNYGNGNGGVRVNPVLNVVPSGNLFGLGSIFSSNRDKNKKR